MSKISGIALVAIGLLHILVALLIPGVLGFSGIWQEIIRPVQLKINKFRLAKYTE
jgi:hypothetical protein